MSVPPVLAGGGRGNRVARRQARRRRLEEAALYLFAGRGYHETSVDEIVGEARTSKTAFYELASSKEEFLRELLAREGGQLIEAVAATAGEGRDHRERLRRGIHAFVTACARQAPLARLLLVESVGISAGIEEVRQRLHGRFAALVEEEVRRAAAEDAFYAAADPVVFGRAVVGAVNEATAHFLSRPGADPEALAAGLCRIFAPR